MINVPAPTRQAVSRGVSKPRVDQTLDLDRLETLLADLEHEHEHLLDLAGQQRDAISRADTKDLSKIVKATAETLGRIANIEQTRRKEIIRADGSLPTVDQISEQAGEHHAKILRDRSQSLRALMMKLKDEHEAVREASLALSNHMSGLMEQVSAKLSHTGTYGRRGNVNPGRAQVVSSLDTLQ
ncbi:MAG: flagellar protein FlgN [Phycisphaerales bacterium]